eukprot:4702962-Lingulodinium_polyedra.AAC.1
MSNEAKGLQRLPVFRKVLFNKLGCHQVIELRFLSDPQAQNVHSIIHRDTQHITDESGQLVHQGQACKGKPTVDQEPSQEGFRQTPESLPGSSLPKSAATPFCHTLDRDRGMLLLARLQPHQLAKGRDPLTGLYLPGSRICDHQVHHKTAKDVLLRPVDHTNMGLHHLQRPGQGTGAHRAKAQKPGLGTCLPQHQPFLSKEGEPGKVDQCPILGCQTVGHDLQVGDQGQDTLRAEGWPRWGPFLACQQGQWQFGSTRSCPVEPLLQQRSGHLWVQPDTGLLHDTLVLAQGFLGPHCPEPILYDLGLADPCKGFVQEVSQCRADALEGRLFAEKDHLLHEGPIHEAVAHHFAQQGSSTMFLGSLPGQHAPLEFPEACPHQLWVWTQQNGQPRWVHGHVVLRPPAPVLQDTDKETTQESCPLILQRCHCWPEGHREAHGFQVRAAPEHPGALEQRPQGLAAGHAHKERAAGLGRPDLCVVFSVPLLQGGQHGGDHAPSPPQVFVQE